MGKIPFDIVLLDADETIFDFKKSEKISVLKTAEQFSVNASNKDADVYSEINLSFWKQLELGQVTRDELKVLRFQKWFECLGVSDVDYVSFAKRYEDNLSQAGILFDGALEFVKNLSLHSKVYIVTNGLAKCQHGRMDSSPVKEHLSGMFISEEVGFTKPDKRYFDYIFQSLNVIDKSKVIIIGDSLTSDMQGGRNAGITTCLYCPSQNIKEHSLCNYIISEYSQFFEIL